MRTLRPDFKTIIALIAALASVAKVPAQLPEVPNIEDYSIKTAAEKSREAYYPSPKDWRTEVIYHLLTDRFFNGDFTNDSANPRGNVAPAERNGIHGGDFAGLRAKLPYLRELGATAVWISPIQLNSHGQYHGYHTFDFRYVDPHWGTMEELRAFVDAAHEEGIRVIVDVICNHMANLIEVEGAGTPSYSPPPAEYKLAWRSDLHYPPPFDDFALFHAHGPIDWRRDESVVFGELYNLDDLKTEREDVRDFLVEAFKDLITATDCDGFRVDTVKHVEPAFWARWNREIEAHAASLGKENFIIFGEVWEYDIARLNRYLLDGEGRPLYTSLLDFPTQGAMTAVFAKGDQGPAALKSAYDAMSTILPEHARGLQPRFIDNHDGARFLAVARQAGAGEDQALARLKLALLYHLTMPGIPIVYYGTEQGFAGIPGDGGWSASREDMFDGAYEHGPSAGDNFDTEADLFEFVQRFVRMRREHPSMTRGEVEWLAWDERPGLLGYRIMRNDIDVAVFLNTGPDPIPASRLNELLPDAFPSREGTGLDPLSHLLLRAR